MKIILILIAQLFMFSVCYATPLSSWDKRMFYAQFQTNCEKEAKKNNNMSRDNIERWCNCVNYETIKQLSREDLKNQAAINYKSGIAIDICRNKPNIFR